MSQPISWYTSRTSAALPTPCFPSTAIVRTLWVAMTSFLLRARSRSLLACRRAARRLVLPLLLFFLAHTFSFDNFFVQKLLSSNFCPRSRLSFWPREEGSAFPPRVGSPILHAGAESGAYSRAPLLLPAFRDGAAAVCLPLPLVRTVWLVGLAEVAPPTPSNALLVDQIRSHELRSTSASSPSRSLTLSSLPQGLILPRPGSSRGGRPVRSVGGQILSAGPQNFSLANFLTYMTFGRSCWRISRASAAGGGTVPA